MRSSIMLFAVVVACGLVGAKLSYAVDYCSGTDSAKKCIQGSNSLKGLHWGVGVLYSPSKGGIGNVSIRKKGADSVVVVEAANLSAARAAFELHYFFQGGKFGSDASAANTAEWAIGPFVSLNTKPDASTTTLFSSVGAGMMLGLDSFNTTSSVSQSFNLGLGMLLDTDVRELAPGIADGQITTLTEAEKDQLVRKTTNSGFMAIMSYNFTLN